MKKQKAALVCSGGGALCAAHLGVLHELEKDGREYGFFVGVSAGAIVCAMKAFGLSTDEIWGFALSTNFFAMGMDFSENNYGLLKGDKLMKILKKIFKNARIEDLQYPLFIGATDFSSGARVILSEGLIVDALRASCGVPVLFSPFYHKEQKRFLVDGGLTQNFPLDIAVEYFKGDLITGIDVGSAFDDGLDFEKTEFWERSKDLQNVLIRTFQIMFLSQQRGFVNDSRLEIFRPKLGYLSALDVRENNLKNIFECGRYIVDK